MIRINADVPLLIGKRVKNTENNDGFGRMCLQKGGLLINYVVSSWESANENTQTGFALIISSRIAAVAVDYPLLMSNSGRIVSVSN